MSSTTLPRRSYVRIKVVSLGDVHTGKSCLIKRYCEKKFVNKYISTIGVDFGVRSVRLDPSSGIDHRVNFSDLSGSDDFRSVREQFHRGSQGVIYVYDVTNRASFDNIDNWISEHKHNGGTPIVSVLVANKVDDDGAANIASGGTVPPSRVVTDAEGRQYADRRGMMYYDTSARSGLNVEEMFHAVFKGIAAVTNIEEKRMEDMRRGK